MPKYQESKPDRQRKRKKIKLRKFYYHTSGTTYRVGDVIGGKGQRAVYMHINPVPHSTIQESVEAGYRSWVEYSKAYDVAWEEIKKDPAFDYSDKYFDMIDAKVKLKHRIMVYKIRPFERPKMGSWADFYTNGFVEIVGIVGDAQSLLRRHKQKWKGKSSKSYWFGSRGYRD